MRKLYLNDSFEIVSEKPQDLQAEVKELCTERFGNYHTSYFPTTIKGEELIFNGWSLKEFYVNRQWNYSYLLKLIVSKNNMPYIDLHDLLSDNGKHIKRSNAGKNALELDSELLRYAINFLESIPNELSTLMGVKLYLAFTKVSTNRDLFNFYKALSDSFTDLTATEYKFLNKLFILIVSAKRYHHSAPIGTNVAHESVPAKRLTIQFCSLETVLNLSFNPVKHNLYHC